MAFEENWDETTPSNLTEAISIDDEIRKVKTALRERLAVEHNFKIDELIDTTIGEHKKGSARVGGGALFNKPEVNADNPGSIYVASDGSPETLFYYDNGTDWIAKSSTDAFTYKGNDIDTDGDGKVDVADTATNAINATSAYSADILASGLSDIDILTGTIAHGETIPLPDGYVQAQCKWFVSISDLYSDTSATGNQQATLYCSANASRVLTCNCQTALGDYTGTANYMIIGVK